MEKKELKQELNSLIENTLGSLLDNSFFGSLKKRKKRKKKKKFDIAVLQKRKQNIINISKEKYKNNILELFKKEYIPKLKELKNINFSSLYESLKEPDNLSIQFKETKTKIEDFNLSGNKDDLIELKKYELGVGKPIQNEKGDLVEILPIPIWLKFKNSIKARKI